MATMAQTGRGGRERRGRGEREILVQHILVKEGDGLLEEILKQVKEEGVAVDTLAQQHSLCPSRSKGGLLGWISRGQTVPEFEAAAFGAPLGEVVTAATQFGFHVIKVLEEREVASVMQVPVEEFEAVRQSVGREAPPQLHPEDEEPVTEIQLVDVREPDEASTAAITGFELYPLSEFGEWAPSIKDKLSADVPTYVLCHHGVRSQQMAQWLVSQGFKEVYNIVGGIDAYSKLVDQSVPRY